MTGEVLAISEATNNAGLIADCARLGYLRDDGRTLDPTWGLGRFWTGWRPAELVGHDLDPAKSPTGVPVDFTDMPHRDGSFDAVVFDPPYKLCLDDETEALTQRGWLRWDQIEVGDMVYSYDTGLGRWSRVRSVNVYDPEPTEVFVCEGKNLDFVASRQHRWITNNGWKHSDEFVTSDAIPRSARHVNIPTVPTFDDALVELVAWFWTEGTVDAPSAYGHITQSHAVNPEYCERIERCFKTLYGDQTASFKRMGRTRPVAPAWRIRDEKRNRRFIFSAAIGNELLSHAPDKIVSFDFLRMLTFDQLRLFIDTSVAADGHDSGSQRKLTQHDPARSEAFALACILAGESVTFSHHPDAGYAVNLNRRHRCKPLRPGVRVEQRTVRLWCPTVDGGSFLARRKGRVYFTGNSGTVSNAGPATSNEDYGIVGGYVPWQDRHELIRRGMAECVRVLRPGGVLLVKCQNQVCSGRVRWQTIEFAAYGESLGLRLVDMLHLRGYRRQPAGRSQRHARQNYSSLLVFERAGRLSVEAS